jgi:hypothetical protein
LLKIKAKKATETVLVQALEQKIFGLWSEMPRDFRMRLRRPYIKECGNLTETFSVKYIGKHLMEYHIYICSRARKSGTSWYCWLQGGFPVAISMTVHPTLHISAELGNCFIVYQ